MSTMLLIMPELFFGGAETQFRYFIEEADENGWQLDVIVENSYNNDFESEEVKSFIAKNYKINFIFFKLGFTQRYLRIIKIMFKLLMVLLKKKYSACLIYTPRGILSIPILRLFGVKVVYSERNPGDRVSSIRLYRSCLKLCNKLTCNSEHAKRVFERKLNKETIFIKNGIKLEDEPLMLPKRNTINSILVPARIWPVKNQMIMLRFLKSCKRFSGKLFFAGKIDDDEYYKQIVEFINQNGLNDRVEFLGFVSNMRDLYQSHDLIALPSFEEGMPNVILESFKYKRPLIVSNIEMNTVLIEKEELMFNPDDEISVCGSFEFLLYMNDYEYCKMIDNNYKIVVKEYSSKVMAKRYLELLSS